MRLVNLISTDMIASLPKAKAKGVSPMGPLEVVLYAHRTPSSSSSHSPFDALSLVLIIFQYCSVGHLYLTVGLGVYRG